MKCIVFAGLLASATAFMAPAPRVSSRSALRMGLEGQVGYDVETGGKPWDPLGLAGISERNNLGINPHIKWLQESEIKHGRTAMLAFLGVIVPGSLGVYVPTYPQEPDFTQAFYKALQNNPLGMAASEFPESHPLALGGGKSVHKKTRRRLQIDPEDDGFYPKTYLYATPNTVAGILTIAFMFAATYLGVQVLLGLQGPSKFIHGKIPEGKEY
ncbi:hypothetical protein NSK_005736 [Nannochloropsis salina CCMP1776]|uniref:Uncharacterized protein n=1 Tax=Nannochloropsis salina CCMP1776 TaxID=1027361 RepID=A0A4D9CZC1_9STRA|nr:hypothetical protein NSK_005736 [Nannochloropsis salina CCMP1776]|eukprot:TFJ82963.1 hypothetical protein NSK_005736 [Nannochloropsis salina CCMP1776]